MFGYHYKDAPWGDVGVRHGVTLTSFTPPYMRGNLHDRLDDTILLVCMIWCPKHIRIGTLHLLSPVWSTWSRGLVWLTWPGTVARPMPGFNLRTLYGRCPSAFQSAGSKYTHQWLDVRI